MLTDEEEREIDFRVLQYVVEELVMAMPEDRRVRAIHGLTRAGIAVGKRMQSLEAAEAFSARGLRILSTGRAITVPPPTDGGC